MKILVACEESQVVTDAFRSRGHQAFSCDIQPTSGNHPEWHLEMDVLPLLQDSWDMILAFPPCTHLSSSGARWFAEKRRDGRQDEGIRFFMQFTMVDCPRVVIENPVGIMSKLWRKPDQIIQPWQFGDPYSKATCLWIKGLPKLRSTGEVDHGEIISYESGRSMPKWYADAYRLPPAERSRVRSRTSLGIAAAMADQWGTDSQ